MTIKISKQQAVDIADSNLASRILSLLKEKFPEDITPDNETDIVATIKEQIKLARTYELSSELAVSKFVTTAWLLGTDFTTAFPAVAECLAHPYMSEDEKGQWLEEFAVMMITRLAEGT